MTYSQFLDKITPHAEEEFAAFQRRLIFTNRKILGIRTPKLRAFAKEFSSNVEELLSFPKEYYETVFIQLAAVATLPYGEFVTYLPRSVDLIDNWAICDCFKAKCIKKHEREFLPILEKLFQTGGEYAVRYVLVSLLSYYMEEGYLPQIRNYLIRTDYSSYYVHMAAAWLTAEVLVKFYDEGVRWLREELLPPKTHNKAIQKAIESYRISKKNKEALRSLKIK